MNCTKCGASFEPSANNIRRRWWFCKSCRTAYNRGLEAKRRAAGLKRKRYPYSDLQKATRKAYLQSVKGKAVMRKVQARRWRDPLEKPKLQARNKINGLIVTGRIKRGDCSRCGAPHAEAHHSDYSKPLDIQWLCRKCHWSLHHGSQLGA